VIPECDNKKECECPFEFKLDEFDAEQLQGNTFDMTGWISTSGAYLKWMRATIVSAMIIEDCEGQLNSYNTPVTFTSANTWAGNNASGFGTSSISWESKECDSLGSLVQDYGLNIPFNTAKECRLKVRLCIRYEFFDCDCNYCEEEICIEFDIEEPISGIIKEEEQTEYVKSNIYPNPAENWMEIEYSLEIPSNVTIKIIDLKGQTVATLAKDQMMDAGKHLLRSETDKLISGAYMYVIEIDEGTHIKPFVISR
jgi:hypothetical protein